MIRTTQTTSFQRVLTSLEDQARHGLESADLRKSLCDILLGELEKRSSFKSDQGCKHILDQLEDILNEEHDRAVDDAELARMDLNNAGQDALDTAAEIGSWG